MLFGLKLTGFSDTLTEASYLSDEVYKKVVIQNNQRIELHLLNLKIECFQTFERSYLGKFWSI